MKKLLSKLPTLKSIKAKVSKVVIGIIYSIHQLVSALLDFTVLGALKHTEDSAVLIDPVVPPKARKPATRRKRLKKKTERSRDKKKTNRKK